MTKMELLLKLKKSVQQSKRDLVKYGKELLDEYRDFEGPEWTAYYRRMAILNDWLHDIDMEIKRQKSQQ